MVTALYLIRHGETEGSEIKRYKGSIDVPLSEKELSRLKSGSIYKEHLRLESSAKYQSYLREIHKRRARKREAQKASRLPNFSPQASR